MKNFIKSKIRQYNPFSSEEKTNEDGFTLAEIVVGVIIILILSAVVGLAVFGFLNMARNAKSAGDGDSLQTAVATYYAKQDALPITSNTLAMAADDSSIADGEVSSEVFQAIGTTLATDDSDAMFCSNSVEGLVVEDRVRKDDEGQVVSGNIITDQTSAEAVTAADVEALVTINEIDFSEIKTYLGAGATADTVGSYHIVTCK